jgi:hypothetical protein
LPKVESVHSEIGEPENKTSISGYITVYLIGSIFLTLL